MESEEPFNKTNEQYYRDAGKGYELESFDKQSLTEIRKMMKNGEYKDAEQLRDHMEYVEELIARLQRIIQDEDKESLQNLSLKRDFIKTKELYTAMSSLLDELEGT